MRSETLRMMQPSYVLNGDSPPQQVIESSSQNATGVYPSKSTLLDEKAKLMVKYDHVANETKTLEESMKRLYDEIDSTVAKLRKVQRKIDAWDELQRAFEEEEQPPPKKERTRACPKCGTEPHWKSKSCKKCKHVF